MKAAREAFDVAALRDSFDRTFAAPPPADALPTEGLLEIRVAGDPYALRVSQVKGLAVDRKIVSFPTSVAGLVGMAGIRGALTPVYSLASLLGYRDTQAAPHQKRWLVLCGAEDPLGLLVDELEGYVKVQAIDIFASGTQEHVAEVVRVGALARGIVGIPTLCKAIGQRCGESRAERGELKER